MNDPVVTSSLVVSIFPSWYVASCIWVVSGLEAHPLHGLEGVIAFQFGDHEKLPSMSSKVVLVGPALTSGVSRKSRSVNSGRVENECGSHIRGGLGGREEAVKREGKSRSGEVR